MSKIDRFKKKKENRQAYKDVRKKANEKDVAERRREKGEMPEEIKQLIESMKKPSIEP
jgi:hypothetical protein